MLLCNVEVCNLHLTRRKCVELTEREIDVHSFLACFVTIFLRRRILTPFACVWAGIVKPSTSESPRGIFRATSRAGRSGDLGAGAGGGRVGLGLEDGVGRTTDLLCLPEMEVR